MADTLSRLAEVLGRGVLPFLGRLGGDELDRRDALTDLGFVGDFPDPVELAALATVGDALGDALNELAAARFRSEIDSTPTSQIPTLEAKVFGLLLALIVSIEAVATVTESTLPGFKARLYGRAFSDGLRTDSPLLFGFLCLAGVLTVEDLPIQDDPTNPQAFHTVETARFESDRLVKWFQDPKAVLAELYGWGTPAIDVARLYVNAQRLLRGRTRDSVLGFATAPVLTACGVTPSSDGHELIPQLSIPLIDFEVGDAFLDVVPLPTATPSDAQQLALALNIGAGLTGENQLDDRWKLSWSVDGNVTAGVAVVLRPNATPRIIGNPFSLSSSEIQAGARVEVSRTVSDNPVDPAEGDLLGAQNGAVVRAKTLKLFLDAKGGSSSDIRFGTAVEGGRAIITADDADGFLSKILGGKSVDAAFDAELTWSRASGVRFTASGGLKISRPVDLELGPFRVTELDLEVRIAGGVALDLRANVSAAIGPVVAAVQGIGATVDVKVGSGNAGLFDVDSGFLTPTGVGISVNAGAISGGGFLSFAPGKYSGAIELEAYSISIKAFGLIETGAAGTGFSMVIVISAEFATPIQLGLGFTLNGVGGMIGINRTVNSDALRALVVAGRTENLLFPKNVIANAPAIIRDLGTVFPAREGHYVFGPLAKLGWGTPTLITAELALILELPGPVLSLIGEVKCLLPKPEVALVKFNMSIAGQLDFPQKSFSLDAALHDSVIEGYPVSGQMAMRLRWGEQPNFALSIGGFHPAYQPPPNFPKLQPMTVALAQTGSSTSVTVSGFFALTSNTLQIGGEARLHAGGSGISLDASIAVKTIFIFSPFSFAANVDASVKISFHGHGPSVHLSGVLSGPSPWRAKGEVCVSILWWDACLRFDQTFGGTTTVPEPTLDPWQGSSTVQGLLGALQDPKNWAALPPPGSFTVVSRAPGASDLVDPLGGFTVRQKAVPVETTLAIARFGPARAAEPAANRTGPIFFKGATGSYGTNLALTKQDVLKDFFAPAQFFELNDAKKLSAKSFDKYGSGYSFAIKPNNIEAGSIGTKPIQYTTKILGSGGTVTDPQLHDLPPEHLAAKSATSAVAKGGFAQSGTRRYVDPAFTQPFVINDVGFTLANADNLQAVTPGAAPLPRADALVALDDYIALHPEKRGQVQVVATYELAA